MLSYLEAVCSCFCPALEGCVVVNYSTGCFLDQCLLTVRGSPDVQIVEVQNVGMRIACANDLAFLLRCWWLPSLVALAVC